MEGFRPTELNPRLGVGLSLLGRGSDLSLLLLHCATIEHPELDWRPAELERLVLEAAERTSVAAAHTVIGDQVRDEREVAIRRDGDGFSLAVDADEPDGTMVLGPHPSGGFLRVSFDRFEVGPPVAPSAVAAFALASETFGLDLPALEAAPDLRPGGDLVHDRS